MAHKAPGKHYRKGISLVELFEIFPDNASFEQWFAEGSLARRNPLRLLRQRKRQH